MRLGYLHGVLRHLHRRFNGEFEADFMRASEWGDLFVIDFLPTLASDAALLLDNADLLLRRLHGSASSRSVLERRRMGCFSCLSTRSSSMMCLLGGTELLVSRADLSVLRGCNAYVCVCLGLNSTL